MKKNISRICELLSELQNNIEHIHSFFLKNFKDEFDFFLSENRKNSLIPMDDELSNATKTSFIDNKLEKPTFRNLLDYVKLFSSTLGSLVSEKNKATVYISESQEQALKYVIDTCSFSFETDGVGLYNTYYSSCILQIYENYASISKAITQAITELRKTAYDASSPQNPNGSPSIVNINNYGNDTNVNTGMQGSVTFSKEKNTTEKINIWKIIGWIIAALAGIATIISFILTNINLYFL